MNLKERIKNIFDFSETGEEYYAKLKRDYQERLCCLKKVESCITPLEYECAKSRYEERIRFCEKVLER